VAMSALVDLILLLLELWWWLVGLAGGEGS
jgi:hypothetical protein